MCSFWLYDQNSQVYVIDSNPVYIQLNSLSSPDPNGLLAFLVSQLQAAEDAGQRTWIIGHIPSGKSDFAHDQVQLII